MKLQNSTQIISLIIGNWHWGLFHHFPSYDFISFFALTLLGSIHFTISIKVRTMNANRTTK